MIVAGDGDALFSLGTSWCVHTSYRKKKNKGAQIEKEYTTYYHNGFYADDGSL